MKGASRAAIHNPDRDVIELTSGNGVTVTAHVAAPVMKTEGGPGV